MEFLKNSRNIPCLDAKSGIKKVEIGKWVPNIGAVNGNELIISQQIDLFEYEARDVAVNSTLKNDEAGEIYEFDINLNLPKVDKSTSKELNTLSDSILIAFIEDEYGVKRVYGLDSGLDVSVSETSGGAKSSFSGYNIKLTGESELIPFVETTQQQGIVLTLGNNIVLTIGNNTTLTI